MGVVATFTRTEVMNVQPGDTIVENVTNLTTGKVCVVKSFQEDDQIQSRPEKIHPMVSEVRNTSSLTSNVTNNNPNTIPKQVLDVVDMANSVDTLTTASPTQEFSN